MYSAKIRNDFKHVSVGSFYNLKSYFLPMLLYSVKDDLFHDNSLRNELDLVKKKFTGSGTRAIIHVCLQT